MPSPWVAVRCGPLVVVGHRSQVVPSAFGSCSHVAFSNVDSEHSSGGAAGVLCVGPVRCQATAGAAGADDVAALLRQRGARRETSGKSRPRPHAPQCGRCTASGAQPSLFPLPTMCRGVAGAVGASRTVGAAQDRTRPCYASTLALRPQRA